MRRPIHSLDIIALALICLFFCSAPNAAELSRGAMLSASCAGCHGTNGQSPGTIPSLANQTAEFIRTNLEAFRSGERASTVMQRHAKGYTDEEIKLIAEHFGQLEQ